MKLSIPIFAISFGLLGYAAIANQTNSRTVADIDFDRDVMPILSQHCFKCHGPDAAQAAGGLRLDSFAGATKANGEETAIVPGSPEKSYLITKVSAKDADMRMPPQDSGVKPLNPDQVDILRQWIKNGAKYEKHWAYVAPEMPAMPTVSDLKWCKNSMDRYVLAKLDKAGLKPEPEADKNTLALRAAETLTGLPPSQAELEAFRRDAKPGAYERYVDRLLTKPEYGEHQARYWLDAVRYGDTHGLQLDNERNVFPYRDWVVRAFNEDLPYDRFAAWQLAGDLLPNPTTEQLIATGYVRMNLTSDEGGAIEEEFLARNTFDRVDTTSTVLLGLTIQCAKCHDHKFDPIKQKDYYGLYAYFDSTTDKPLDGNELLPAPAIKAPSPDQDAELKAVNREMSELRNRVDPAKAANYFANAIPPVPSTRDWQISPVYQCRTFDQAFDEVEPAEPGQTAKVDWKPLKFEVGKDMPGLIGKDNASVYVRGTVTLPAARTITFGVSSDDSVRVWLNGKLIHSHKIGRGLDQGIDQVTGDFKAGDNELVAKLINGISIDGLNIRLYDMKVKLASDAAQEYRKEPQDLEVRERLDSAFLESGPATPEALKYRKIEKDRTTLEASIPMCLIAQEMPKPRPTFILKRGQYDQKGDPVNRHIPPALGVMPTGARQDRLGFSQWLTSPANPLFARVYVNRLWQQHFGVGIVKTSEDFGSQGE